jgi:hypothetical protein
MQELEDAQLAQLHVLQVLSQLSQLNFYCLLVGNESWFVPLPDMGERVPSHYML